MALFSFAGEGSKTMEQFLADKVDKGEMSDSPDAPVRTGYDSDLDKILGYMKFSGTTNFAEAYKTVAEEGFIDPGNEGVMTGILMNRMSSDFSQGMPKERMEAMGLPSMEVLKEMGGADAYALGDFSGTFNRLQRGGQQELNQLLYGVGDMISGWDDSLNEATGGLVGRSAEDTAEVQAKRKTAVADAKFDEQLWKGFNAKKDPESESGYNLPWNMGGVGGEMVPGLAAGGGLATIIKGTGQVMTGFGVNAGMEYAKYKEHQDKLEAGLGIGSGVIDFLPYLKGISPNAVSKGMRGMNWASYKSNAKLNPEVSDISKSAADKRSNAWKMIQEKNMPLPYSWADNMNRVVEYAKNTGRNTPVKELRDTSKLLHTAGARAYTQGLDNIGLSKEELAKLVPEDKKAYALGHLIRQKIQLQKQKLTELGDPFREAYRAAGENLRMDTAGLVGESKNLLKDPSAMGHLNRSIKGVTNRETRFSKEATKRLEELAKQKLDLDKSINTSTDSLPLKAKDIATRKEELANLLTELDILPLKAKTPAGQAKLDLQRSKLQTSIKSKTDMRDKLQGSYKAMDKQRTSDIARRNAGEFELKDIEDSSGILDMDNMTANQLADVIQNLNAEIKGGGNFAGEMSKVVKGQLQEWQKLARAKLRNLDPSFSEPYGKAKDIEGTSLGLFGEDSPIIGLDDAYTTGTDADLEDLFKGTHGLDNLGHLGQWMDSKSNAYGGAVRANIEDTVGFNPIGAGNKDQTSKFDFEGYTDKTKDIDFDEYRKLLPDGESEGVDFLSGLSGTGSLLDGNLGKLDAELIKHGPARGLPESEFKNSLGILRAYLGKKNKPMYRYVGTRPTMGERLINNFDKGKGAARNENLVLEPAWQRELFEDVLSTKRSEQYGEGNLVTPVKQSEEGMSILNDPNYN